MAQTNGGASDPVTAIANAIGSLSNTVTAFVSATAQKYGLQKGTEVRGVDFERQKTLDLYSMAIDQKKSETMILVVAIIAVVIITALLIFKRK
jgi:Na+(H+)/acetate symporter ActP